MPLDKCPKCIETGFFGMHIRMYKMFTFFLFWLLNHLCNLHVLFSTLVYVSYAFNNIFQQHNIMLCIFHKKKNPPSTWLVRTRYRPTYNIVCIGGSIIGIEAHWLILSPITRNNFRTLFRSPNNTADSRLLRKKGEGHL